MKIGDTEITRDMLPTQISWNQTCPEEHLFQTVQDILNAKLGTGVQLPQTTDTGMMNTAETNSQWR